MRLTQEQIEFCLPVAKNSKLFCGLDDKEIISSLGCLSAMVRSYQKEQTVFAEGDRASFVGIILDGEIQTQKLDYDGNINIVSRLFSGAVFAAVASYSSGMSLPFDIVAGCKTSVLCLNNQSLLRSCTKACVFHQRIIQNMLSIIADKNIELSTKIGILTKRTLREKILAFLNMGRGRGDKKSFCIALSRLQMAEYLSVNRSALSRELAAMKNEGIIDFSGNTFTLL